MIDNVVRNERSADGSVQGVRAVVDPIAAGRAPTAAALQTLSLKGWDGLIIARRS